MENIFLYKWHQKVVRTSQTENKVYEALHILFYLHNYQVLHIWNDFFQQSSRIIARISFINFRVLYHCSILFAMWIWRTNSLCTFLCMGRMRLPLLGGNILTCLIEFWKVVQVRKLFTSCQNIEELQHMNQEKWYIHFHIQPIYIKIINIKME